MAALTRLHVFIKLAIVLAAVVFAGMSVRVDLLRGGCVQACSAGILVVSASLLPAEPSSRAVQPRSNEIPSGLGPPRFERRPRESVSA
jgi:hypothetical protein